MKVQDAARNAAAVRLYEEDFYLWTQRNSELLAAGRVEEADLPHIAEEIRDMGISQRRELGTRLRVLILHLLKWRMQRDFRSRSWQSTIRNQRSELMDLLDRMPSLRKACDAEIARVYPRAAQDATEETELLNYALPPDCPYSIEQILDRNYFPD